MAKDRDRMFIIGLAIARAVLEDLHEMVASDGFTHAC